jgi:hypothetical protein
MWTNHKLKDSNVLEMQLWRELIQYLDRQITLFDLVIQNIPPTCFFVLQKWISIKKLVSLMPLKVF